MEVASRFKDVTIGSISFIKENRKATLMSINSFTFSVIMIVMSPVFGFIFQS